MLFEIKNATVSLGGKEILSHISMEIREGEKVALVGPNGAGKTTLLKLITGELTPDRDDKRMEKAISSSRSISIGMLSQLPEADLNRSVEDYLLSFCTGNEKDLYSRERFDYEVEFHKLFTGFGFAMEDMKKSLAEFSGGELTRISLIHLLLEQPDLLLLDEPTNHLDLEAVEWLEIYMRSYRKAVIFVSHDRFFLDRVAEVVYELDRGELTRYSGNYSDYRREKAKHYARQLKAYEKQQKDLEHRRELVEKFKHKPKKAAFARAQRSQMDRMEIIERPVSDVAHTFTTPIIPELPGSKVVYEAEKLLIGYEKKHPLADLTLRIRRGQKIAVIGANGSGKSTFLKTVVGQLSPLKGKGNLGNQILIGYYEQRSASQISQKTVYEHFKELYPGMQEKDLRKTLGNYLFSGEAVYKKVADLSGGERSRLYLAELICAKPNFMVLDEPTNHMDIQARETLESAFSAYKGTMLFVSHDRYFVSQVADAILLFENGKVYYYPFGYQHYLDHCKYVDTKEITALISAEDQAMVDGLRAVPKPERGMLRQQSTESAYIEWKRKLAFEPVEAAWDSLEEELKTMESWSEVEKKEQSLTAACLNWYDVYLETE